MLFNSHITPKKIIKILALSICYSICQLNAGSVVIVMGPSCVGKSTTIETLSQNLGSTWKIVDFDEIEIKSKQEQQQETNEDLFKHVIQETNSNLSANNNVIVDTNVYFDQHAIFLNDTKVWHLLLYAPLEILLARDADRTNRLNRTASRALRARNYVIKSFNRFFDNRELAKVPYDCLLTTTSDLFSKELMGFTEQVLIKYI